jgi:RimJ/RimL family protein N-acetyltransferase
VIRVLTPADAVEFRRIRLEALLQHPDAFGVSHVEASSKDAAHFANVLSQSTVFAAEHGSRLVGTAAFSRHEGQKIRHKGLMWAVYVGASHRGQGLAEMLVRAVIDHARRHVRVLQCSVVTENAAARDIYLRLGFQRYGTERRALCLGHRFLDEDLLDIMFDDNAAAEP